MPSEKILDGTILGALLVIGAGVLALYRDIRACRERYTWLLNRIEILEAEAEDRRRKSLYGGKPKPVTSRSPWLA